MITIDNISSLKNIQEVQFDKGGEIYSQFLIPRLLLENINICTDSYDSPIEINGKIYLIKELKYFGKIDTILLTCTKGE